MPTKFKLVGVIAVIAGLIATFGIYNYIQNQKESLENQAPALRSVIVAGQDLPLGKKLLGTDLKVVEWPEELVPYTAISDSTSLIGRALKTAVYMDELLMESKLAPLGSDGGFSSIIPPGMRAMTVSVNNFSSVSGFVLPNTRVDVLVTVPSPWRNKESYTRIILEDIPVLAVDQMFVREDDQPVEVKGVTLLVNPRQAEKLGLAANEGQLQLTLRNTADRTTKTTYGVKTRDLLYIPVPKNQSSASGAAIEKKQHVIEVIRPSERSEVKVGAE
ncbi:Flp pilus assembly protein CpaB [bacterium]|nr:Flp pilus assembly protein CpaB [bacterium]